MVIKKIFSKMKFGIFTCFFLVLIFIAVGFTTLNTYKPVVKAYVNDNFIGYFTSEQHFDEVYNELVIEKQNDDASVKVYLESEPTFETSYVRGSRLSEYDVYSNLRSQIKTEYTIYNLAIKDKSNMTFLNMDDVNEYSEKLKSEIPKLELEVSSEKVEHLDKLTSIEEANKIAEELIKENKKKTENKWNWNNGIQTTSASAENGIWPTKARYISSYYGWRWGTIHTGTDIAGRTGDPIYAYMSGTVTYSGWANSYGYIVKINHGGGMSTWYAHNSKLLVRAGQYVKQGETIALMGSTGFSTGPHLHFEVRKNGVHVNSYPYIAGK